jgi:hypothetical protein
MKILFGRLKDIDIVTALLKHITKIAPGYSSAGYCKVHLN